MHLLGDEDINAYIDGRLDAEHALSVAAHLAAHPREAARAASYRAGNDALRLLFDAVVHQPVPEPMRALLRCHKIRTARRRRTLAFASAMMTLVLAGIGGRALQQHLGRFDAVSSAPAPPSSVVPDMGHFIRI
jgi:anti-sigma factor RsiW